jgi:type III restriction enzyme
VPARRGLYDHVEFDSETERKFVKDLERRADVRLYVKLPSWFIVETPVGRYNPDWAIVMENPEDPDGAKGKPLLYLVRETKKGEPRPSEQQKTDCGERHFKGALEVDYRVVTSASQLP